MRTGVEGCGVVVWLGKQNGSSTCKNGAQQNTVSQSAQIPNAEAENAQKIQCEHEMPIQSNTKNNPLSVTLSMDDTTPLFTTWCCDGDEIEIENEIDVR